MYTLVYVFLFVWSLFWWRKDDDKDYFALMILFGIVALVNLCAASVQYFFNVNYIEIEPYASLLVLVKVVVFVCLGYMGYKTIKGKGKRCQEPLISSSGATIPQEEKVPGTFNSEV